jgi:hypothetical protein
MEYHTDVGSFPLEPNEEGQSVCVISASTEGGSFYVVGTTQIDSNEQEPSSGRLLLFSAFGDGFRQVGQLKITGAPYAIAKLEGDGLFAAAVNSQACLIHFVHFSSPD